MNILNIIYFFIEFFFTNFYNVFEYIARILIRYKNKNDIRY